MTLRTSATRSFLIAVATTATLALAGRTDEPTRPAAEAASPKTHTRDVKASLVKVRPAQPAKMEKAAFLGVGARPADPTLASQLDLPRGIGLSVFFVEPDSPAAAAGLEEHDVLHKFNEQLLVNTQQFATLVRTFKAGDEVTLSILRKGKPMSLKAKLVERELPALADLDAMIRINGMPVLPGMGEFHVAPPIRVKQWEPFSQSGRVHVEMKVDGEAGATAGVVVPDGAAAEKTRVIRVQPNARSQIVRNDGKHTIRIDVADGQKSVSIRDADGNSLFEGPINTPQDEDKIPDDLRQKVRQIEADIEVKVGPSTQPASEPKAEGPPIFFGC